MEPHKESLTLTTKIDNEHYNCYHQWVVIDKTWSMSLTVLSWPQTNITPMVVSSSVTIARLLRVVKF